jgi:branched-chain amino acid transport system permease protein
MPQVINWEALFGPQGPLPSFFGGGRPLNFPLADDATVFGVTLSADRFFFYYLGLASAILAWGLTAVLSRRKFGYSLVAVRENEVAAEVMGINTTVSKSLAYVLSAALAALGGAIVGYRLTNMTTEAEALFSTANNLQMIIICLIGGRGTLWGPWIGAFILFAIQELLRTLSTSAVFLQWQAVIFSVLIVLVVLFLPRGLMQIIQGNARFTPHLFWRNLLADRV